MGSRSGSVAEPLLLSVRATGCGRLAGNGGQMAETLEKRRRQQKNKTAERRPRRKSSAPTESEVIAGDQDAGDVLRAAIDKQIKANSLKIAKAMVDKTIGGNASVARLLVDFTGAKKRPKPSAEKTHGPSWAQRMAAELPSQGPVDPEDDIGFGGREPEV